jgi:hypothetical protein
MLIFAVFNVSLTVCKIWFKLESLCGEKLDVYRSEVEPAIRCYAGGKETACVVRFLQLELK